METLGVGLILPLVSSITTPDIIESNKYAKQLCEMLDLHSTRTFMIVIIAALILIFIFKNLYLFLEYYIQYRFTCNNRFSVQRQLMHIYMERPYEYFLNADSGEIVGIINNDIHIAFVLLSTVLSFFTEAVISFALILTIIITDPLMAFLLAFVLSGVMLILGKIIKPILKKAGLSLQKNGGKMNKWLLQSVSYKGSQGRKKRRIFFRTVF